MSEYFLKPNSLGTNVKVQLDSSNVATKANLKKCSIINGVETSSSAKRFDLDKLHIDNVAKLDTDKMENVPTNSNNLESKVDKLDIDKLVRVPVDLSKLSDLVKSSVVKKDVYNAKMKNIEDKIPVTTNLTANASLNAKISEVKGEMSSIANLATAAAFTTVENKVIVLVKKSRF